MSEHREPTAPSVDGWEPIETAPREEGHLILACRQGSLVPMVTDWDEERREWFTFNLALETGNQRRNPNWRWLPTHWKPLDVPPTERVELGERSNTESSPTTAAATRWQATLEAEKAAILDFVVDGKIGDDPSPPAVVDYTERARTVMNEADHEIETWKDVPGGVVGRSTYIKRIAAALSAVASEHKAEIASMRGLLNTVYECERSLIAERDAALAKLARLREPEMREALIATIGELRARALEGCFNPSDDTEGECADGDCYCTRQIACEADATLAVITERLT